MKCETIYSEKNERENRRFKLRINKSRRISRIRGDGRVKDANFVREKISKQLR
jgi:hypothetical protein